MKTFRVVLFSLFILFAFHFKSIAQAPAKQWDFRFGGSEFDDLRSLHQTNDGGYILGGYSYSGISGDKTQPSQGDADYWIVKTDTSGVKQWDARFGGNSADELLSLQQTTDGGYILGGRSHSDLSGDRTQASRGYEDYWIVKTNVSGVKQWDARFGGNSADELLSLQQTTDGGYILGGFSYSGISGDKTQASQGYADYWIVKTDISGVKQWDARFGGNGYDFLLSLQQTTDGGYILGGQSWSDSSGDKTQSSQGFYDYWIVKTDASGVKQWDARFGGSDGEYLLSLQQTTDGGYILGGSSESGISGDKTQSLQGILDYWIVKTDASGVKQWDARFGGSEFDYLYSLQQTTDGGYILGGYSDSGISGDKTQTSQGGFDYWIVKTDVSGVKQWDARFGGSEFDYFHSLQQTSDSGYILGGYSESGISGDKTQTSRGSADYWIVKMGGCYIDSSIVDVTICQGDSFFIAGGWQNNPGIYYDRLTAVNGCDSISATNIIVLSEPISIQVADICEGDSILFNGKFLALQGYYADTFKNANNCDSIVGIDLTVHEADTTVSVMSDGSLLAAAGNVTYQWIYCSDNTPVSGADSQSFYPSGNGYYAVVVSAKGCADTSSCYKIIAVGNSEIIPAGEFKIYPNPAKEQLIVEWIGIRNEAGISIKLMDLTGRVLIHSLLNSANVMSFDISRLNNSMYILGLEKANEQTAYFKFVKIRS